MISQIIMIFMEFQILPFGERKRLRLDQYDYSSDGYYFVTICTKDRVEYFGKIENEIMVLSDTGKMAEACWVDIPSHFENVQLDEFIVMPNHIHGIIIIDKKSDINMCGTPVGDADRRPLQIWKIDRTKMLLPKIINLYKSSVTQRISRISNVPIFSWQRSYHDHIIRNERSLNNIRSYIQQNPESWENDVENAKIFHTISDQNRKEYFEKIINTTQ